MSVRRNLEADQHPLVDTVWMKPYYLEDEASIPVIDGEPVVSTVADLNRQLHTAEDFFAFLADDEGMASAATIHEVRDGERGRHLGTIILAQGNAIDVTNVLTNEYQPTWVAEGQRTGKIRLRDRILRSHVAILLPDVDETVATRANVTQAVPIGNHGRGIDFAPVYAGLHRNGTLRTTRERVFQYEDAHRMLFRLADALPAHSFVDENELREQ